MRMAGFLPKIDSEAQVATERAVRSDDALSEDCLFGSYRPVRRDDEDRSSAQRETRDAIATPAAAMAMPATVATLSGSSNISQAINAVVGGVR